MLCKMLRSAVVAASMFVQHSPIIGHHQKINTYAGWYNKWASLDKSILPSIHDSTQTLLEGHNFSAYFFVCSKQIA